MSRKSIVRAIVAASAAVALLAPASPATPAQGGSKPPTTKITARDVAQKGLQRSYCWGGMCADYMAGWPPADRGWTRSRARIRIRLADEPDEVDLSWWPAVDEDGFPQGDARSLRVRIVPQPAEGTPTAYDLRFRLPRRRGHAYIALFARWDAYGDSSWTYHLRLRTPPGS